MKSNFLRAALIILNISIQQNAYASCANCSHNEPQTYPQSSGNAEVKRYMPINGKSEYLAFANVSGCKRTKYIMNKKNVTRALCVPAILAAIFINP